MMSEYNLTEVQWCFLDLLMRGREKGIHKLNRLEMLNSTNLPQFAALSLAWAALSMPSGLVHLTGQHDFSITDEGISLYNLRFGKHQEPPIPTQIADAIIYLSGPKQ